MTRRRTDPEGDFDEMEERALRAEAMVEKLKADARLLAVGAGTYTDDLIAARTALRALLAAIRVRLGGTPQGAIPDPLSAAYARGIAIVGDES